MATPRKIYILTEDGHVKGATYNHEKAEAWMNLGAIYDYFPLVPEDIAQPEELPESAKEQPAAAMERTRRITQEADELAKRLEKKHRRFEPKSPLLQD